MSQRKPHIGDWADHKFTQLDPRPVVQVSDDGEQIRIQINTLTTSWLPAKNYAYKPMTIAHCDCGSVDKHGDDLGEHGPTCPYRLIVIHLSQTYDAPFLDAVCANTLKEMSRG